MADIYNADLTSSAPSSITLVNMDVANIQNFAGAHAGLQHSNANTDGFDILGFYHNVGIASVPYLTFECTHITNILQASDSRWSLFGIGTTNGLAAEDDEFFSVYRFNTNNGISATLGSEAPGVPADGVFFNYAIDTLYIARIRIQPDGSAKAYIALASAPEEETFLGSSAVGAIVHTPYTEGTPIYFARNGFKSFAGGNKAAINNTIRVYIDAPPSGSGMSTSHKLMAQGRF